MYAILRTQKIHKKELKAMQSHHARGKDAYISNPDIDKEMSKYNICVGFDNIVKTITDLTAELKPRRNATLAFEVLITASPEFFPANWNEQVKSNTWKETEWSEYLHEMCLAVKKKFEANYKALALHLDEKTPHVSMIFTPITADKRLCCKEILNRNTLKELQDIAGEIGSKYGLKRGVSRDFKERRMHFSMKEYKAMKDAENTAAKLSKIRKEIVELEREIKKDTDTKTYLQKLCKEKELSKDQIDSILALIEKYQQQNAANIEENDNLIPK